MSQSYNQAIIAQFRAHGGVVGGEFESTPLLLLHHVGAKSEFARVNPLGYVRDDGRYVIVASNGGSSRHPDWYHNLVAHPNVVIQVGGDTIAVHAEPAVGAEHDRLFMIMAGHAPQLTGFQEATARRIPVIVLTPAGNGSADGRGRPPGR